MSQRQRYCGCGWLARNICTGCGSARGLVRGHLITCALGLSYVLCLDGIAALTVFTARNGSEIKDRGLLDANGAGWMVGTMLTMSTGPVGNVGFLSELIFPRQQHELYTNGSAHLCDFSF